MAIPIAATLTLGTTAFNTGINLAAKGVSGLVSVLKAASIAVVGLAGAFTLLVTRQAALIDRIGKVSAVVGLSTDLIQKFGFAAEQAGVSTDQAQVALRRFSRRLGEAQKGTGELLPALRRLNISTKNADGSFKSAEEVLLEFADGIANTEDQTQRLALAFKAFDSEGAELVKTLEDGSAGLQEFFSTAQSFGLVLDRQLIQGVEDFNDALNLLTRTVDGQVKRVLAAFATDLEKLANFLANQIRLAAEAAGGYDKLAFELRNKVLDIIIAVTYALEDLANVFVAVGQGLLLVARELSGNPLLGLSEETRDAIKRVEELDNILEELYAQSPGGDALVVRLAEFIGLGEEARELYNRLLLAIKDTTGIGPSTAISDLLQRIQDEKDRLQAIIDADGGVFDITIDLEGIREIFRDLQDAVFETTEYVNDFKVATIETNRELDLTLGYWERIILQIKDFFTRDLPQSISDTIELIKSIGKSVAERLLELSDPIKTIEDGLVKAGQKFEDSLVQAIMTGKSNFEDFRNLLRETFARALVQKFITGPIFGLFGLAKGGPAKAGQPYIVGEEGPELFVPGQSGTVIPNHQLGQGGGAATSVVYNIQAVDAPSFQSLVARDPEFIYNVSRAGARRTPA